MIHEHQALRQLNSKKNSQKYAKVWRIDKYIGIRYILEIRIPDFLCRNVRDNRLLQTSLQETDMHGHVG